LTISLRGTGARIGEGVAMTWHDMDLVAHTATLYGSKPKPWKRTARLPPPVLAAIANIPSNLNPGVQVFQYLEAGNFIRRPKIPNFIVKSTDAVTLVGFTSGAKKHNRSRTVLTGRLLSKTTVSIVSCTR
jgi:integrase